VCRPRPPEALPSRALTIPRLPLSGRGSATGAGTAAALLLASFRDLANTGCVDLGRDPLERDVRTIRATQVLGLRGRNARADMEASPCRRDGAAEGLSARLRSARNEQSDVIGARSPNEKCGLAEPGQPRCCCFVFSGRTCGRVESACCGWRSVVWFGVSLLARIGGRGLMRPGELAGASDALGGVSCAAALLELRRLGRSDSLLERRQVVI
jgi:hypothetical protein